VAVIGKEAKVAKKKIGEFLVEKGLVPGEALATLPDAWKRSPEELGNLLVEQGCLEEPQLTAALGEFFDLPVFSVAEAEPTPALFAAIPGALALKYRIVPVALRNNTELLVACSGPIPRAALENLRRLTAKRIRPVLVGASELSDLLEYAYSGAAGVSGRAVADGSAGDAIALLDGIILKAVSRKASDIHIEPEDPVFRVRFRVDGMLGVAEELPRASAPLVVSRIKVLAGLDIAERRKPQDGAIVFNHEELNSQSVNIRVSILPCGRGEKAVLRLLPPQDEVLGLENLGMTPETLAAFRKILMVPHGIVMVTGPTGSGKSTTLYSVLSILRNDTVNITTIEDPIELKMKGINQVQTDSANKITFAGALRSILRQDPDIIMVGEIRDGETARLALRSALTGHLVLSTLHTNDSASAFTRLLDIGCEPYLLASSVRAVLAQRLVRKICPRCREERAPTTAELGALGLVPGDIGKVYRGKGCFLCNGTGFRGRTGLFELLTVDEDLRGLITGGANPVRMREYAAARKVRTLRDEGTARLHEGITSPDEIIRVTTGW